MAEPDTSAHPMSATEIAAALEPYDTPTVANAIESFGVELRNQGYVRDAVHCMAPHLPPSVGYAFTLRVRSSSPPPLLQASYVDRTDWWDELLKIPRPRILVIEDGDREAGTGAFIGGLHAHILRTLGCVAAVTNGAVRDLPQAAALGFQLFAGHVSVSHAYTHVVESGTPVRIAGLEIHPGDLLHGDVHGLLRVPPAVAEGTPAVAARMQREEKAIIHYCQSGEFSLPGLREMLKKPGPPL